MKKHVTTVPARVFLERFHEVWSESHMDKSKANRFSVSSCHDVIYIHVLDLSLWAKLVYPLVQVYVEGKAEKTADMNSREWRLWAWGECAATLILGLCPLQSNQLILGDKLMSMQHLKMFLYMITNVTNEKIQWFLFLSISSCNWGKLRWNTPRLELTRRKQTGKRR